MNVNSEEQIEQMLSPQKILARFIANRAAEKDSILPPRKIRRIERRDFNQQGLRDEGGLLNSIKLIPRINV